MFLQHGISTAGNLTPSCGYFVFADFVHRDKQHTNLTYSSILTTALQNASNEMKVTLANAITRSM